MNTNYPYPHSPYPSNPHMVPFMSPGVGSFAMPSPRQPISGTGNGNFSTEEQHPETAIFVELTTLQQMFNRVVGPKQGLLIFDLVSNGPEKQKFFNTMCVVSSFVAYEMMGDLKSSMAKLQNVLPEILTNTQKEITKANQEIADAKQTIAKNTRIKEIQTKNAEVVEKGLAAVKDDSLGDGVLPSPEKLVLWVVTGNALVHYRESRSLPRFCTYEFLHGLVTMKLVDFRTMSANDVKELFKIADWDDICKLAPFEASGMIRALGLHGFKESPDFHQNVWHYKQLKVLSQKFTDKQIYIQSRHGLHTKKGLLAIYLRLVPEKYLDCSFELQLNESLPWFDKSEVTAVESRVAGSSGLMTAATASGVPQESFNAAATASGAPEESLKAAATASGMVTPTKKKLLDDQHKLESDARSNGDFALYQRVKMNLNGNTYNVFISNIERVGNSGEKSYHIIDEENYANTGNITNPGAMTYVDWNSEKTWGILANAHNLPLEDPLPSDDLDAIM